MDFQLRLRTDDVFNNIEYIKHWLEACERGYAFEHDKPGNHHYHVYLFGLDRKPDPMRKYLAKYLPTKECYSVGTTAGKKKEPINTMIAYQYGTEATLKEPVWVKGFDEHQMEVMKLSAAAFYKQKEDRENRRKEVVTEILVINQEKAKPDRVWEHLMTEMIENPNKYDGKAVHQIKSMISVSYLNKLKAIPRPSDLHRYAVSLYYINKHGLHVKEGEMPEDELDNEYLR